MIFSICCFIACSQKDVNLSNITNINLTGTPTSSGLVNEDSCIHPIVTEESSVGETNPTPTPLAEVPPIGWEKISELPEEYKDKSTNIVLIHPRVEYDDIWVSIPTSEYTDKNNIYLIYRTDTSEWRIVPTPPGFELFLDKNNEIWTSVNSQDENEPRLYRFDEKSEKYIPVIDRGKLLRQGNIESNIEIDSNGLFWFIFRDLDDTEASHQSLYSFNPSTLEATSYSIGNGFNSLEIDQNDYLYLIQNGKKLIKFDHITDIITSIDLPIESGEEVNHGSSLLLDSSGRLWVSDRVRIEQATSGVDSNNLFLITRSPIFITYVNYLSRYVWFRPRVVLESNDDKLWFSSENGNAWYKPATEEWCLFTTYGSNIVEDTNRDLWMSYHDALYRLSLHP